MISPIKLKIALQYLPHKCERTVLVPEDINMRQLHFVIQYAMGWENDHLFQFSDLKKHATFYVTMSEEPGFLGIPDRLEAYKVSLKDSFLDRFGAKPFWYNYDFGDDWLHKISIFKVFKTDLQKYNGKPVCIKAEGKCPPEDIGGVSGYSYFLDVIRDKKHPEHYEQREWHGLEPKEHYDEFEVSLEDINEGLSYFYESDEWKDRDY